MSSKMEKGWQSCSNAQISSQNRQFSTDVSGSWEHILFSWRLINLHACDMPCIFLIFEVKTSFGALSTFFVGIE